MQYGNRKALAYREQFTPLAQRRDADECKKSRAIVEAGIVRL